MDYKLENAELKTTHEAVKALIDGNEFWLSGERIFYDHNISDPTVTPFRVQHDCYHHSSAMTIYHIERIDKWQKKVRDTKSIADKLPIVCFAGNTSNMDTWSSTPVMITRYNDAGGDYKYISHVGGMDVYFKYIRPVSEEESRRFIHDI